MLTLILKRKILTIVLVYNCSFPVRFRKMASGLFLYNTVPNIAALYTDRIDIRPQHRCLPAEGLQIAVVVPPVKNETDLVKNVTGNSSQSIFSNLKSVR